MNDNFGYLPDYEKIAEYAATLNPGWGDDIAGLAATDDGSDAFLWRGIVACLKNASLTVQARWLLKNTNNYLTISSFNQGKIGCHLPDTEVLTQIGWKLFKDITLLDKLATVNPANSKLYFECPTKIIQGEYNKFNTNKLIRIHKFILLFRVFYRRRCCTLGNYLSAFAYGLR